MKTFYRRNLPHIQPIGATYFVTFRLSGSIPKSSLDKLAEQYKSQIVKARLIKDKHQRNFEIFVIRKKYLIEMDAILDKIHEGPHFLKDPNIMGMIGKEIKKLDGTIYNLIAYSIMSNHVHLVFGTGNQLEHIDDELELNQKYKPLDKIMKQIKGSTAICCNRYLCRTGQFWERESYDIYIRNEKMLNNVIAYTLNNPVKAGLVQRWEDYPGNYFVEGL